MTIDDSQGTEGEFVKQFWNYDNVQLYQEYSMVLSNQLSDFLPNKEITTSIVLEGGHDSLFVVP